MRTIGPKLNSEGKLTCDDCSEYRLHDYYGNICRLGNLSPEEYERLIQLPTFNTVTTGSVLKLCPYYAIEIRDNKLKDLLK